MHDTRQNAEKTNLKINSKPLTHLRKKKMLIFAAILLNFFVHVAALSGFTQANEYEYLQVWPMIMQYSYQADLPLLLVQSCKASAIDSNTNYDDLRIIILDGYFHASHFQSQCGTTNHCILSSNSTLIMDGNVNVAALTILGKVYWNDTTQLDSSQWLCAGFAVVEQNGEFNLSLNSLTQKAYIYIKDNGAVHPGIRSRAFGGFNFLNGSDGPTIDISGRSMERTWSVLLNSVPAGSNVIRLVHNPIAMGWQLGDRITIAPTTRGSSGYAESFFIQSMSAVDNSIVLSNGMTMQSFNANFIHNSSSTGVALLSAEVINLSRNVIITGDDFRHVKCDPTLTDPFSSIGCSCNPNINRTVCTMGLHTIMAGKGTMRIQYTRVEKCGQRGVFSKYCLHFHMMGSSADSVFRGNAIENSQQRGIIVHHTHLSTVEYNVLSDVRGSGIYIQDGTETFNNFLYNVIICPTPKSSVYGGCTLPGTDNGQADGTLNQAGLWSEAPSNDMIGNRFANSFNGMFYSFNFGFKNGLDTTKQIMGRVEGNTFHGHGRFGTYILFGFPTNDCLSSPNVDGILPAACSSYTSTGLDNGHPVVLSNNLDYDNVFVGGYSYGDIQYFQHTSVRNLNNIYWKESKNFADGCSAHISNGYFSDGNIALPDQAAIIIENSIFTRGITFEAAHHCNSGPDGCLCMPTYVLSNVTLQAVFSSIMIKFHSIANNNGGIFVLSPPEQVNPTGKGGFFPPAYNSLVSNTWTYLLDLGADLCNPAIRINDSWPGVSAEMLDAKYSSGIFCKKPVRSLKIYTRGLTYATASDMLMEIWKGNTRLSVFTIPYFQIGRDASSGPKDKQGYAVPVIADTSYEYVLSMSNKVNYINGDIPEDWLIEFSDPVIGNKWSADEILLTVSGRKCNKTLVTSQHDRRWGWTSPNFWPDPQVLGRGACSSDSWPDMPSVTCPLISKPIAPLTCDDQCVTPCGLNQYCDCGSKQCICNPGYLGNNCSTNICDAARCGKHGKCIATYLGGNLSPTQGACVCEDGWSGPNCDINPCNGITCSGNGYCQAKGDTDYQCICEIQYTGYNCEKLKIEICSMCPANFLNVCGSGKITDNKQFICRAAQPNSKTTGCVSPPFGSSYPVSAGSCCYENCEKCSLVRCPVASNDCHISGACDRSTGLCQGETARPDGSSCNSVIYGKCLGGICQPTFFTPGISPVILADLTSRPSVDPNSPTMMPSKRPSIAPIIKQPTTRTPTKSAPRKPDSIPTLQPLTSLPSTYLPSAPTGEPTSQPTSYPSGELTSAPSVSNFPSFEPSTEPSKKPSKVPSIKPTKKPQPNPTKKPSVSPKILQSTYFPTTRSLTFQPSSGPTTVDDNKPTSQPTSEPTLI